MPASDRPKQLPLALSIAEGRSRDDLVVTDANRQAIELIDSWPRWPAPVVVLAGPSGSGKSHIGAAWLALAKGVELVQSDLEPKPGDPDVRPVFVDDADGDGLDETGLFHRINAAQEAGSTVLLAARRFPSAWGVRLPDLASRLKAAATVEIQEPDDALLAGVITKLFADRQVEVEPHVVAFLVRRIERSLATAIRVVDRLDQVALEQQSRITRAMAADLVNALDQGQSELDF